MSLRLLSLIMQKRQNNQFFFSMLTMLMYVYMHCSIPVLSCPMLYLPWGGALAHVDLEELDFSVQTGRGQSCAIGGESSIHHSLQSKPFPIMPTSTLMNHTNA